MRIIPHALRLAALGCLLAACRGQQSAAVGPAPSPTPPEQQNAAASGQLTLELTGSGLGNPTVFTFEQLRQMDMTRLDHVLMQKSHTPDEFTSWRGPSLEALLTAAQIKPGPMLVTLEAADGYRKRCSREQLKSAIVALQDGDGRWLSQTGSTCPLRLVPPELTGDYWIRDLCRITVVPAGGSAGSP